MQTVQLLKSSKGSLCFTSMGALQSICAGDRSTSKFDLIEVGAGHVTGKLGKCISPNCVSSAPMQLSIQADVWNKTSTVTDDEGQVVMTTKAKTGLNRITVTVHDGTGAQICVATGKKVPFSSASFQIFKPSPSFDGQAEQTDGYESRVPPESSS